MSALAPEEIQKRSRRRRLVKGLLLGGAAIGLPALVNRAVARRAPPLGAAAWGRSSRFPWGRADVAYQHLGIGDSLVALHSFGPGHDSAEWRTAAELLAPSHQILVPDLPGWGLSANPSLRYTARLYTRFLREFLAEVVRKPALILATGHSAAYAIDISVAKPELVRGLVLITPRGLRFARSSLGLLDALIQRLILLPVLGTSALNFYTTRASLSRYLEQDLYAAPERVDSTLVEHHYRSSHQRGAHRALAALLGGLLDLGVKDLLPRLSAPVWLAWGRRAKSPPVETADLWLHHLGNAQLEVFEGSAILPHAEQPELFCAWLEEKLNEIQ
jgi:pimeloyl-ACP methyl ester carboxylesterase